MRVRLADIPPEGLQLKDTISLKNLNTRMSEGRDNDIEFLTAPEVDVLITRECGDAQMRGAVRSTYSQPCPRCLEPLEQEIVRDLYLILKRRPLENGKKGTEQIDDWSDDIGIKYFDDDQVDLEEVLQEALILELHPFGLEHTNCPGVVQIADGEPEQENPNSLLAKLRDAGLEN